MTREEVEALLAACVPGSEAFVPAMDGMTRRKMRALCRAWLALDGADSMQVLIGPRGFGEIICMPSLIGQRVRIAPEQGEGERG